MFFLNSKFFLCLALLALAISCGSVSSNNEERGDRYYRFGQYDDSLAEYLMAQKTKGVSTNLLRKIGKVYVMKGDFFQAKKYYDRYFKANDSAPSPEVLLDYLQIAIERGRAGDTTTMVHALEEMLEIEPSFSLGEHFFDLGEYYFQAADYRKAIACFLRGIPLNVDVENRDAYLFHLALSYEKLEDYFNAFLYFDQFIILYPDNPQAEQAQWHRGSCCYPLAEELFGEGDIEGALFYLDEIIVIGLPQHLVDDANLLRGEILFSEGRLEEAKDAYRWVLKLNPIFWKEKNVEQARKRIQELELNKKLR